MNVIMIYEGSHSKIEHRDLNCRSDHSWTILQIFTNIKRIQIKYYIYYVHENVAQISAMCDKQVLLCTE